MKGRPPKPTALHELEGWPGKQAYLRKHEPKPRKLSGLEPPEWLTELARAEWERVGPELERLGLVTVIDRGTLEVYCDLYGRWREAVAANDVKAILELTNRLSKYIAEFGLSPAARVKIHADEPASVPLKATGSDGAKVTDPARFFQR